MAEDEIHIVEVSEEEFPSNSNKTKERVIKQVAEGTLVEPKKNMGKLFGDVFSGDSLRGTGNFLWSNVVMPAVRSLIYETIKFDIKF